MRQINLLPESLKESENKKKVFQSFFMVLGPAFLGIAVVHFLMALGVDNLENKRNHPTVNVDTLEFSSLREQIQKKSEEIEKYAQEFAPIIDSHIENYLTLDILKTIGTVSWRKVWFTRFDLDNKKRTWEVEGKSFNTRLVSEFMLGIKKTPFFDNVTLISMEKGQDEKVSFKIVCALK